MTLNCLVTANLREARPGASAGGSAAGVKVTRHVQPAGSDEQPAGQPAGSDEDGGGGSDDGADSGGAPGALAVPTLVTPLYVPALVARMWRHPPPPPPPACCSATSHSLSARPACARPARASPRGGPCVAAPRLKACVPAPSSTARSHPRRQAVRLSDMASTGGPSRHSTCPPARPPPACQAPQQKPNMMEIDTQGPTAPPTPVPLGCLELDNGFDIVISSPACRLARVGPTHPGPNCRALGPDTWACPSDSPIPFFHPPAQPWAWAGRRCRRTAGRSTTRASRPPSARRPASTRSAAPPHPPACTWTLHAVRCGKHMNKNIGIATP
jgi:hypothetical protein